MSLAIVAEDKKRDVLNRINASYRHKSEDEVGFAPAAAVADNSLKVLPSSQRRSMLPIPQRKIIGIQAASILDHDAGPRRRIVSEPVQYSEHTGEERRHAKHAMLLVERAGGSSNSGGSVADSRAALPPRHLGQSPVHVIHSRSQTNPAVIMHQVTNVHRQSPHRQPSVAASQDDYEQHQHHHYQQQQQLQPANEAYGEATIGQEGRSKLREFFSENRRQVQNGKATNAKNPVAAVRGASTSPSAAHLPSLQQQYKQFQNREQDDLRQAATPSAGRQAPSLEASASPSSSSSRINRYGVSGGQHRDAQLEEFTSSPSPVKSLANGRTVVRSTEKLNAHPSGGSPSSDLPFKPVLAKPRPTSSSLRYVAAPPAAPSFSSSNNGNGNSNASRALGPTESPLKATPTKGASQRHVAAPTIQKPRTQLQPHHRNDPYEDDQDGPDDGHQAAPIHRKSQPNSVQQKREHSNYDNDDHDDYDDGYEEEHQHHRNREMSSNHASSKSEQQRHRVQDRQPVPSHNEKNNNGVRKAETRAPNTHPSTPKAASSHGYNVKEASHGPRSVDRHQRRQAAYEDEEEEEEKEEEEEREEEYDDGEDDGEQEEEERNDFARRPSVNDRQGKTAAARQHPMKTGNVKTQSHSGSFDDIPIHQAGKSSSRQPTIKREVDRSAVAAYENAIPDAVEQIDPTQLVSCSICTRRFNPDRIEQHEAACEIAHKKRKQFDLAKMRIAGTDIEKFERENGGAAGKKKSHAAANDALNRAIMPKKSSWREKHESFISSIRAAKGVKQLLEKGVRPQDLPPPPPPMENPDYVACPTCARKFNQSAAERHIPFCSERTKRNKPAPKTGVALRKGSKGKN